MNGVTFAWPLPSAGFPDNTVPDGTAGHRERRLRNADTGVPRLGHQRPGHGAVTLHYSDGSTSTYWLGFSDWTLNGGGGTPSYGNQVAATTSLPELRGLHRRTSSP